jgi:serine/threonine-protein kinase
VADDPRVQKLLDELFDSESTPEAVCADFPELLPQVRSRWERMRALESQLDALFPTPDPEGAARRAGQTASELPRIPGYDVVALLGRGGMGVVYKARHLRLNRFVALKMLITGTYAGPHERMRFQREAEAVASLRHPSIVQIYDVGDHDGWPYFTMELLDGGTLAQALAGVPQPARRAAELLTTLAGATHAAHHGGIVHRDLKPSNILFTSDGVPKIADFGVARHFDDGPALTLSGARIGTPSYMAPEQVVGKPGTIGPLVDVYALGAILYESLTGRPPFRADSATETQRQLMADEPVRPARLNPRVPRDLETICLKCLEKDPARRYATAAALADDLKRFQQSEPIAARRAGLLERIVKWVRRHPTTSAMLATGCLLVLMMIAGGVWLAFQQARRREAVYADLREMSALQDTARWSEARLALKRADDRLEGGGPLDLRHRLDHARSDLSMVEQLDAIRLKRVTRGELGFYKAQANVEYTDAFRQAGLRTADDNPSRVAARINASAVRGPLLAAIYDWAVCAPDQTKRRWLLEVARQTEGTQDGWRDQVLDPAAWDDRAVLEKLARTAPVDGEDVSLLLAFGERLKSTGTNAAPFVRSVQTAHPADFWANLIAGNATLISAPQEAAGYYRAALASRPQAPVAFCSVGDAMKLQQMPDQAVDYYQRAIGLDPSYARAYSNLGSVLHERGLLDDAIKNFQKALQLDPDYAWAHWNFASTLRAKGRLDEAVDEYQQVVRVDPENVWVHYNLACVLVPLGRGNEAIPAWRKLLDANPRSYDAWSGCAELCLFLGQRDEYHRIRRGLLGRFADYKNPTIAEPVSRACSLERGTAEERQKAAALAARAVAAGQSMPAWIRQYHRFAEGLAEYRQGRLDRAISLMEGEASRVMGPAPRLVLAMAQHDQGNAKRARETLARAVVGFDWDEGQADMLDVWIAHILRREAEALILPNLHASLRGTYLPADNTERLALVAFCEVQRRYHRASKLFSDAFSSDAKLGDELASESRFRATLGDTQPVGRLEDLSTRCRYPAARCATLASCGMGEDAVNLAATERSYCRQQAIEWLNADLKLWADVIAGDSAAARIRARSALYHWQHDPHLAALREPSALDKLPTEERRQCAAIWESVADLLRRTDKRN